MLIECNGPEDENKREQNSSQNKNEEISKEIEFLKGIIYLNPKLSRKVKYRVPRYSFKRFVNACDVKEAFPSYSTSQVDSFLETFLDEYSLEQLTPSTKISHPKLKKLIEVTKARVHESTDIPEIFTRAFCSPWLSKEKPLSIDECQKSPLKGKIYACISARHSAEDDFVVVQETENLFGYSSHVFSAKATVAFPPICKGEVWTVGWIQALKKSDLVFREGQNKM